MSPAARPTGGEAEHEADDEPARCRCGHTRSHHMVSPVKEYTVGGYLLLFFGITAKPVRIRYVCRTCEQQIEMETLDTSGAI